MINLGLTIENPWSDRFDAGYCWGGQFLKNKAWEFQAYRSNTIIECSIRITARQDHAGLHIEFCLLTFSFVAQVYDTRHWNYDKKEWTTYDTN